MRVSVLFFGVLKEVVGCASEELEVAPGGRLSDLFQRYSERHPRLAEIESSILLARNQEFAPWDTPLEEGDEVAFLPPVSGGVGPYTHLIEDPAGHLFALTREPIDSRGLAAKLIEGRDGAVVTFEGVVRDNTKGRPTRFLEYECYEAMAVKGMAEIGRRLAGGSAITRIAMVHRLGRLEIGEASVAVVVTAPHRKPAFEAALEAINRLKLTVPIWKKEHFEDGEVWVEGEWDESLPRR